MIKLPPAPCRLSVLLVQCAIFTNCPAADISTSFEFFDDSGLFSVGTAPITATFADGIAQTVLSPGLYQTGMNSWMISPATTGTITFETPAPSINLWFRDQLDTGGSELVILDTADRVVATFTGSTLWQNVVLNTGGEANPIATITLTNNGAEGWAVIDDFVACVVVGAGGGLIDPIPEPIATGDVRVGFEAVATGLTAPIWATSAPGLPERLFVVDQPGVLWNVDLVTGSRTVFLDVATRLVTLGVFGPDTFDERGLLGVAFHPDYQKNGLLYTYTSEPTGTPADFSTMPIGIDADHQSVISEWHVNTPSDPDATVDPKSHREVLRVDQPQFNHNAGAINFGLDGLLYVAFGDGGGADDLDGQDFIGGPIIGHGTGNGQDPSNILGTLIRIDPSGNNSSNGQYGVPADNPFVIPFGTPVPLPEIFAYGFRNPFRFSIDTATGDIYLADVGQNDIEEVDIVTSGGNYGWSLKEGSFFFDANGLDAGFVTDIDPGVPAGLIDPIAEYDHDEGIAIIGGFVYHGARLPVLESTYVFGDWSLAFLANNGRLFYLTDAGIREFRLDDPAGLGMSLQGFGQDANGEVYVLANTTGTPFGTTGVVLRIVPVTGDIDGSGGVGFADLLLVLGAWGPCPAPPAPCPADLDGDGAIGFSDLITLLANWG